MTDVFSSDQSTGTESTASSEPASDLLRSIVNEEGVQKYDSVEKALVGLQNAQEHIRKLQEEARDRQSELDKRLAAEEVLKELKASKNTDEKPSTAFDADAIKGMVHSELEALTAKQRAERNIGQVNSILTEKYGDKAKEVLASKAAELKLSVEKVREIAATSPDAVLSMFGMASNTQGSGTPGKVTSSVSTESSLSDTGTKNWRYWQRLRRENPREYASRYNEIFRARESMSADDWNR